MSDNLNTYSSAALAYLGDCAIELCVREYLVKEKGFSSSAKLNKEALRFVKASSQAEAMKNILGTLTEEETDVFHRGRNMGHTSTPKSATVAEYRNATGMEALFGWLYLAKNQDRINELFRIAYQLDTQNKNNN